MNPDQSEPSENPELPETPSSPAEEPAPKSNEKACLAVGAGLFVVGTALSVVFRSPFPLFFATLGALTTLGVKGYRLVFVGFLGVIVLLALSAVVYCSAMDLKL
ncbi:MAG TPA: hypothetical protein VIM58_02075 [Candidatus Methylacidiphilales bacterium]